MQATLWTLPFLKLYITIASFFVWKMSSIDGSIYLSMDASHIAEDRRAISKKLRRHQMQKQSSKRQGGFEKTSQMIPNEENFNEADYEEQAT